ncbi:MAG: hypothetical protein QXZ41_02495 [Ignisphaera sp.]|uniref:FAD-binding protein n=1 Tax=Ignisphaera aggregans TaxID=334771 RepID=A0A7C4NKG2_9CREN
MLEVDILVVGSGIATLKALQVAEELGRRFIAVDSTYLDGGYAQVLEKETWLPKAPLFVYEEDVDFFRSLGIEVRCFDVNVSTIKSGDYTAKTLSYTDIDVQKNWFLEWINSKKLCLHKNIFSELKKVLGYVYDKPIHIASGIRRIDLAYNVAALTNGVIVKFKQLIYTWPLPLLPKLLAPENVKQNIAQMVESLNLKHVSTYILVALLASSANCGNKLEIYVHSTKASKMHTAVSFNIEEQKILYAITSYTKNNPLLPGIHEKLISELKRFKIATPKNIEKTYGQNITYALISKTNPRQIEELKQKLLQLNVYLYGRLGQWREQTIKEIIQNQP